MNGILCAYLRATDAEHAQRRRHGVAAALDGELHDVLRIEIDRVRARTTRRRNARCPDRPAESTRSRCPPAVRDRRATAGCLSTRAGRSDTPGGCGRRSRAPAGEGSLSEWSCTDAEECGTRPRRGSASMFETSRNICTLCVRATLNCLQRSSARRHRPSPRCRQRPAPCRRARLHLVAIWPRARRGMPRREQRAAVLVRNDRDWIRADPLRLGGNLVLVHADERPQHRQRRRLGDDRSGSRASATRPGRRLRR